MKNSQRKAIHAKKKALTEKQVGDLAVKNVKEYEEKNKRLGNPSFNTIAKIINKTYRQNGYGNKIPSHLKKY